MEFPDKKVNHYCEDHTTAESSVLSDLNRKTHLKVLMPNMLSGHLQGRLLAMLSSMIRPERVLEIGTYTGYSAICFAEGLKEGGKITTIDINEELEDIVYTYLEKAGVSDRVDFIIGNALELIPGMEGEFDLVFIDADKENYLKYYELVLPKLKPGGFIIADNVLWSGKVLDGAKHQDAETSALIEFNETIHNDPRVANILLPVRDGLMLLRKI